MEMVERRDGRPKVKLARGEVVGMGLGQGVPVREVAGVVMELMSVWSTVAVEASLWAVKGDESRVSWDGEDILVSF